MFSTFLILTLYLNVGNNYNPNNLLNIAAVGHGGGCGGEGRANFGIARMK